MKNVEIFHEIKENKTQYEYETNTFFKINQKIKFQKNIYIYTLGVKRKKKKKYKKKKMYVNKLPFFFILKLKKKNICRFFSGIPLKR